MNVLIHTPDGETNSVPFVGTELTLGKTTDSDIVLSDSRVSRRHARLERDGQRVFLEDLGSTNGTWIGQHRIESRTPPEPGQRAHLGPFDLEIQIPISPGSEDATFPVGDLPEAVPSPPASADAVTALPASAVSRELSDAPIRPARPAPIRNPTDFGPLAPLVIDESITEIMVNGCDEVFVERGGRLEETGIRYESDDALRAAIAGFAAAVGRSIDDRWPLLDARWTDGSRINAVLPPLAIRGPYLTIRRFPSTRLTARQLIDHGAMSEAMCEFLRASVSGNLNLLVSGGSGSGKTTVLNALLEFADDDERIVTIEDAAELRPPQRHVLPMETRPPDANGQGLVTVRDLVRNALRMRPDRIVVSEVRGGEALDMLQAMNTGHDGSLSTIHSNTDREALSRLETLSLFAGNDLPIRALREQIVGAIRILIHTARVEGGRRVLTSISELTGMEGRSVHSWGDLPLGPDHGAAFRYGIRPAFPRHPGGPGNPGRQHMVPAVSSPGVLLDAAALCLPEEPQAAIGSRFRVA